MELMKLAAALQSKQLTLATVESCTGGSIAAKCTDVSGSSDWFVGAVVTYSNVMKVKLGVIDEVIKKDGAVSRAVVEQMALHGRHYCRASWCIAVTGIAGPNGGTLEKPVGTVWIAWAGPDSLISERVLFNGDRYQVRQQTVDYSLTKLIDLLK